MVAAPTLAGEVAPQDNPVLPWPGRRVQLNLDATPGPQGARSRLAGGQLNGLLSHLPAVGGDGLAPAAAVAQLRVFGVLAHDGARLALVPALQQGASAEMAVGNPHLA